MKTIGVLGGVGPQATMEFERLVHSAAQRLLPQRANSGYPPMVVAFVRAIPFATDEAGVPEQPVRAAPELLEAAAGIGRMADFVVIPSNATHLVRKDVERAAGREVLSMIELVLAEVERRGWRRVGALGFGDPVVYTVPLRERGVECETIAEEPRGRLDAAIFAVMEGAEDAGSAAEARAAVADLRVRGVDGLILGCTEIPLLLGEESDAEDLIDPLPLLADAAVRQAMAG